MATTSQDRDALGADTLSVALIGPEELPRRTVARSLAGSQARMTQEFASYPGLDDVPKLLESKCDVVIIELDSDPEHALDLVKNICATSSITVMVYSARSNSDMLVRCMQAGAREFLALPIAEGTMDEALVRTMARRPAAHPLKKKDGKILAFMGAKGGSGTTTIASNFAVALAQETLQSVLLIDLGLPIGDVALGLGIRSQFSTTDALQNPNRLDTNFLLKLLVKHSSGLSVLAAPDEYTQIQATAEGVERLLAVAQQNFNYIIVDAGRVIGPASKGLIEEATTIYLISQVSVSELRNSNRLISEFLATYGRKPEIVLNRFNQRPLGIGDNEIKKALNQYPRWKIPRDSSAALRVQNTAYALVLEDSTISRVIRQMARTACGLPENQEKKKRFSLFG